MSLPNVHRNQTVLPDLSLNNLSVAGSDSGSTNALRLMTEPFDRRFGTIIRVYPDVKLSGKSAYMNILKAMINLSYSEGTHAYAGETFSFPGYTNVKIRITPATSSSSDLQYRFAIWGLYRSADYLTMANGFSVIIANLYWSASGSKVLVGVIEIFPDPLPDILESKEIQSFVGTSRQAETLPNFGKLANISYVGSNETDLASPTNAGKLSVFLELQGPVLSIPEVFMMLFRALVHIASFGTAQIVHAFQVRHMDTMTELVYEDYGAPRTSPPFFVYHEAARALGYIPKFMFAQHKFEAVTFVLEIDGTPIATGYLRKFSSTSSVASQKV
ncbi:hypothetical protein IMSHALPRED_004356 [Imshaugia aleurites]|uniref:Uncharacterized protein n=1 Tax=Imshaugia aleurites TaxID=172621 RepID=A0A8H3FD28_9LECA|nr:hypothetical protein IMSHALPRED_004356 [Imshaugia aleurites]